MPAQFTTASIPARTGAQPAASVRPISIRSHFEAPSLRAEAWPASRATATTSIPSLASRASTAEPMKPVAPISSTRRAAKAWSILESS